MEAAQARVSLSMSKCHIAGNQVTRNLFILYNLWTSSRNVLIFEFFASQNAQGLIEHSVLD